MVQLNRIFSRGLEHAAYSYIYANFHFVDLPWNSIYTWYFSAIIIDFCGYYGKYILCTFISQFLNYQ